MTVLTKPLHVILYFTVPREREKKKKAGGACVCGGGVGVCEGGAGGQVPGPALPAPVWPLLSRCTGSLVAGERGTGRESVGGH